MSLNYLPWNRPAAWGDHTALRDDREELTYDQFALRVAAVAEQFAELGVGHGSVVAIMLPNRIELLTAIVAAWRLGAAASPINPVFTPTEAEYQIKDADADLVIVADGAMTSAGRGTLGVDELRTAPIG